MKKLLAFVVACAALAAIAQASHEAATSSREVAAVAQQSLATFAQLVTDRNFRALGFDSPGEVKSARAEVPIPLYMVRLDSLRAFSRGNDSMALLVPLDKAIVPLSVQGIVKSSVTVERRGGRWTAEGFGSPKLARALDKTRRDLSGSSPSTAFFAVHVAALSSYFLGHREGGRLMLTTIVDDANLKAPAGRTIAADDAFTALSAVARQHNGLPM